MCQYRFCQGDYGKLHAGEESVALQVDTMCPKCDRQFHLTGVAHFGAGEDLKANFTCSCGYVFPRFAVRPRTMFLAKDTKIACSICFVPLSDSNERLKMLCAKCLEAVRTSP